MPWDPSFHGGAPPGPQEPGQYSFYNPDPYNPERYTYGVDPAQFSNPQDHERFVLGIEHDHWHHDTFGPGTGVALAPGALSPKRPSARQERLTEEPNFLERERLAHQEAKEARSRRSGGGQSRAWFVGQTVSIVRRYQEPVERVIAAKLAGSKYGIGAEAKLVRRLRALIPETKTDLYDASPAWGVAGWRLPYPNRALAAWVAEKRPPDTSIRPPGLFSRRIGGWRLGGAVFMLNGELNVGMRPPGRSFDENYVWALAQLLGVSV